jgi:hypothetical protein
MAVAPTPVRPLFSRSHFSKGPVLSVPLLEIPAIGMVFAIIQIVVVLVITVIDPTAVLGTRGCMEYVGIALPAMSHTGNLWRLFAFIRLYGLFRRGVCVLSALALAKDRAVDRSADAKGKLQLTVF